jgi:anti-sigma regulatory factor (Ser/Thr protein kinase)
MTDSSLIEIEGMIDAVVPARVEAVAEARAALAGLELPDELFETARLLVSELVTNSIQHAGLTRDDPIRVRASWSGTALRVSVHEPREPRLRATGAIRPAPGAWGWGLYLVDRLAKRWGVDAPRGYWFEIQTENDTSTEGG